MIQYKLLSRESVCNINTLLRKKSTNCMRTYLLAQRRLWLEDQNLQVKFFLPGDN